MKTVTLKSLVQSYRGGSNISGSDYVEIGVPVLQKKAVVPGGKAYFDGVSYCSEEYAAKNHRSCIDKSYLITSLRDLVPEGPNLGYVVKNNISETVLLAQGAYGFLIDNELIDRDFLIHYSNTYEFRKRMRRMLVGSTQVFIRIEDYLSTPIPLPSLQEQRKIAQILSTWDEAIEAVKELIEKKKTAKRVLHSSIFSENSKSWQKQRLSDVVIILDNKRVPLNSEQRNNMLGNIPYYGANGVVGYVNDYIFDEDLILMAEDGGYFDEYKTRPIAYKITGKAWVNNHAHVLKVREGFDYNFIFHSLEHKNILRFLNGGTRAKLNRGELEKLPIYLPRTYEEQKEIGNLFAFIDEEIELQGDKLVLLKKQKNGLMQRLLTGKVRVSNHD